MQVIGDLIERDLNKKIREVVKVNQNEDDIVYEELTEYVFTNNIIGQYRTLLDIIRKGPVTHGQNNQDEAGFWVSGFFGSGKSSFAKNLGYILSNPTILGKTASEIFKQEAKSEKITALIDSINQEIPMEVLMFDISADRDVRNDEPVSLIIYRKILEYLDYARDFDIADIEIELEEKNSFELFKAKFHEIYPDISWESGRKGKQKLSRISTVFHDMDPKTYPHADSWVHSLKLENDAITVNTIIDRIFSLMKRRRPGRSLCIIVDEVGQYIARDGKKLEDLRVFEEQLGKESHSRLKQKGSNLPGPFWLVVTSQEQLQEVIDNIEGKRVLFAKLLERFTEFDLAPSDIREVATRRVLAKKPEAIPILTSIYTSCEGKLSAQSSLERSTLETTIDKDSFIQFYPYLSHYIELSISIMSGIRLQKGGTRHLGGSNRTIIKQSYEMLVNEKTNFSQRKIGDLVTIEKIYDLVEGSLSSDRRREIDKVAQSNSSEGNPWTYRVTKAIGLLEYVKDLPRTEKNIAALLIPAAGQDAPLKEVKQAINDLESHDFIRSDEYGYHLLSEEERGWADERRKIGEPKTLPKLTIIQNVLTDLLSSANYLSAKYKGKNFKIAYLFPDKRLTEGNIEIVLKYASDPAEWSSTLTTVQDESREKGNNNTLFWVMAGSLEIDNLITECHRSLEMESAYERLASQHKISPVQRDCLNAEKRDLDRYKKRLQDKFKLSFEAGTAIFRGVTYDGSSLGSAAPEMASGFVQRIAPDLFDKLEMGAVNLTGKETDTYLTAANLNGLPQVFYDPPLSLVSCNGGQCIENLQAPVILEVLGFIHSKQEYGTRVSGKDLDAQFTGFGYGWDRDLIRMVLAVLFRAGKIEVTHGDRYTNYTIPASRTPFVNNTAYKSASFAERFGGWTLKDKKTAADLYEEITGTEVDMDEAKIVQAFSKLADTDYAEVIRVHEKVRNARLPIEEIISIYRNQIDSIRTSDSDGVASFIISEGRSFAENRRIFKQNSLQVTEELISAVTKARTVISILPTDFSEEVKIQDLTSLLNSEEIICSLDLLREKTKDVIQQYKERYQSVHDRRSSAYGEAIRSVKEDPDFASLDANAQKEVLLPLTQNGCNQYLFDDSVIICGSCKSSIREMEADIIAVSQRKQNVLIDLYERVQPVVEQVIERVILASFFPPRIEDADAVDQAIDELREDLYKRIEEGKIIIPQ